MPMPMDYAHASEEFEAFLRNAKEELDLTTRNQTFTAVEGVLLVFRARLTADEALAFAGVLPPVLRAIFVAGWDPEAPKKPFADHLAMNAEVRHHRQHHNFAPEHAIERVAAALVRHVDEVRFRATLQQLGPAAVRFWTSAA
ncbi:DUF2267 domain-containing protein [Rhodobium gokarnense]|uniref:Uncharacterized protein (DUF2267 family) n=1 Tax=Rhodobium gokarnense TaxID=364296 RepID=A0ABT3HCB2_9HYPH|nr:DUF2267 domain-containing protein [Rhodobium gokarnense]MCW2308048.1 uncharacterized protein (DUF2267 family) [Rhodobium gokarnense]